MTTYYRDVIVQKRGRKKNVGIIQLNRPKVNALNDNLLKEINIALNEFDSDSSVGAIVITGSKEVFSAGSDIKMMESLLVTGENYLGTTVKPSENLYQRITDTGKPIIAAVNGIAYGGGCEIAMLCDIVYAGQTAKFGQPEIVIGVIPGAGGTQRLPKYTSKSFAMEVILSGQPITAEEAKCAGLVTKVFPDDQVVFKAIKLAEVIASRPQLAVSLAKKAVNASFEQSLENGLQLETSYFHILSTTDDHKEGMRAFLQRRNPDFKSKL